MQLTPSILTQGPVRLEPFAEHHRAGLAAAAEADLSIFQHMPFPIAQRGYSAWFDWLRAEQEAARWIPHAIFHDSAIVGQSCYLNIDAQNARVEIGGTWYRREAQGTAINPAAKLALLEHAFACGAERVEFKTDSINAQSRAALTKLGAQFEGIFRRRLRRPDGSWRDDAYFSIIEPEWPDVRAKIAARIA